MRGSIFVVLCLLVHPLLDVRRSHERDNYLPNASWPAGSPSGRRVRTRGWSAASSSRSIRPIRTTPASSTSNMRDVTPMAACASRPICMCCARPIRRRATACCCSKSRIAASMALWAASIEPRQATIRQRRRIRRRTAHERRLHAGVCRVGVRRARPAASASSAPAAMLPAGSSVEPLSVEIMVNERTAEAFLIDDPAGRPPVIYPPADMVEPDGSC